MVISSSVVKCQSGIEEVLKKCLNRIPGVNVEATFEGQLIMVLETPSLELSQQIMEQQVATIPQVLGVYPVYINCDTA